MPNITELTELAKRKLIYAGVNTEGRLTIAGNAEQIVGYSVMVAKQLCDEHNVVLGPTYKVAADADKLTVVANMRYYPGGDQPGTYVLNFGPGTPQAEGLVKLSDAQDLVHDLSVVKHRQDEILQGLAVMLDLSPSSDWLLIGDKVLELLQRPSLKVQGVTDNGTTVTIDTTLTPATVEAFKVQWPADAPVAEAIDWKG